MYTSYNRTVAWMLYGTLSGGAHQGGISKDTEGTEREGTGL